VGCFLISWTGFEIFFFVLGVVYRAQMAASFVIVNAVDAEVASMVVALE
jgi:hypothetical protein